MIHFLTLRDLVSLSRWTIKILFFLLINLLCSAILIAQKADIITFKQFGIEHGLSNHSATGLLQDQQGFIWVGTVDGLNKYDGYQFVSLLHSPQDKTSISDSYVNVNALLQSQTKMIWIGTQNGLNKLDPATGTFTRYTHDPNDLRSLSHNYISAIFETRSGVLWVGTQEGLNRYDPEGEQFVRYIHIPNEPNALSSDYIASIQEDSLGNLWIGTWRGGLNKFDTTTQTFSHYLHDPRDRSSLSHNDIQSLLIDRSNQLWIGTLGGGLNKFDLAEETFTHYIHNPQDQHSISHNQVLTIYEDTSGQLWIGTFGGGLNLFNPETGHFVNYLRTLGDPQSLPYNQVSTFLEDHTGNMWVGTWEGLARVSSKQNFKSYTYDPNKLISLNHTHVTQVFEEESNGMLWLTTMGGGLNKIDQHTQVTTYYTTRKAQNSLSHNDASSLWKDHTGILWVATVGGGLNAFDPHTEAFIHYEHIPDNPYSIGSNLLYAIYEDSKRNLWIGTVDRGLNRYDRATDQFIRYRHDSLDSTSLSYDAVWTIYEDHQGVLWVGTFGGGLDRLDLETGTFFHHRHDPNDPYSLPHDRILAINEDVDGNFWIGTMGGGLSRFDRETGRFHTYTEAHGLPHRNATCILPDDAGNLWVSTSGGLAKFIPSEERFVRYGVEDGLLTENFYSACDRSDDGELFFGSYNGLVAFHPDSLSANTRPPLVRLTGFELFNEPAVLDSAITHKRLIRLPHNQNFVAFRYAALDFTEPSKNEYAYKLEGIDEDWVQGGDRRYVPYPNLSPGVYTFRVKASNNEGIWNEEGTSVGLIIASPFHKTWWFRTLVVLGIAGVFYGAYQYRVFYRSAVKRTRQRIADDLHDDIGSKLSGIAIAIDMTKRLSEEATASPSALASLAQDVRNAVSDLRDSVWIVDSGYDDLPDLVARMKEVIHRLFPEGLMLEAPDTHQLPPTPLQMEFRRQVLLILKEALNNTARHAHATRVEATINYEEDTLSFCITDNGKGFDPETVQEGRGMRTLRRRTRNIRGKLSIDSTEGQGTTVRFSVKMA